MHICTIGVCVVSRESYLVYIALLEHIRHEQYTRVTNYVYVVRSVYMYRQPRQLPSLHCAVSLDDAGESCHTWECVVMSHI